MDKEVLEQQLNELCQKAMQEARSAVEQAPDGQWIAASEWQIRDIFQRLTRECYQAMLQSKAEEHPTAKQAAFSPCGPDAAEQGQAPQAGAQRRRRGGIEPAVLLGQGSRRGLSGG
jgi:hypothetical protein